MRGGIVFSLHSFILYLVYGIFAYCAVMDVRHHRVPNWAIGTAAVLGIAGACAAAQSWFGTGAPVFAAIFFVFRFVLVLTAGFPFFLFRMAGAGDIKLMALISGCFGLERGFKSIVIGLCLGAVLALGKMLQCGSAHQRFMYLTAYIRRLIQSKEIEAYYCPNRDGYQCVIPLGACFCAGVFITGFWKS